MRFFVFATLLIPLSVMGKAVYREATLSIESMRRGNSVIKFVSKDRNTCHIQSVAQKKKVCRKINRMIASIEKLEKYKDFDEVLTDASTYKIRIGKRQFKVGLKAPEECEAFRSGKLRCKKNILDPLQKLLLELQNH